MSPERRGPNEIVNESERIDRLSAAVQLRNVRWTNEPYFIGWTREGLPMVQSSQNSLTEAAKTSYERHLAARLSIPQINYSSLVPVEYAHTGQAIDYADLDGQPAEDLIVYGVKDKTGKTMQQAFGESTILDAIMQSSVPWQNVTQSYTGEIAVTAQPMYTLFVPQQIGDTDQALAVLFKPLIAGESNAATYKSFVRNTIGRLLVLDESQPRDKMKGYLNAAKRHAGIRGEGKNPLDMLLFLRQFGIVDFEDQWLENRKQGLRNIGANALAVARLLGLVSMSDDLLENFKHPLPNYDVDELELPQLLQLVSEMRQIAHTYLRGY